MKAILTSILLSLFMFCYGASDYSKHKYTKQLDKLTKVQQSTFLQGLEYGLDNELGYLMVAISWKESNLGLDNINKGDGRHGSYSVYQILVDTAMRKLGIKKKNEWKLVGLKSRLLLDHNFAADLAVDELKYWYKVHKGNIKKTLASYNAGWKSTDSARGSAYAEDILLRVKVLEAKYGKINTPINLA